MNLERRGRLAHVVNLEVFIILRGFEMVPFSSFISYLDIHCRLGRPSLQYLKTLVLSLSHISSLDCERMFYSLQVDKRVDRLFD